MSEKNISWLAFNNIVPLVTSAVLIALSFGTLMTRVAVLETKIDTLLAQNQQMLAKYSNVEVRYGDLSLKVRNLETIEGIK